MRALALLIALVCGYANAQVMPTRPATDTDFAGYWRILLVPNAKHGRAIKNEDTGYADPCQFLFHGRDGQWKSVSVSNLGGAEETVQRCPSSKSQVENAVNVAGARSVQTWVKKPNQDGLFLIKDSRTNDGQIWKVDYVAQDLQTMERLGLDLKKGDLIVQLTKSAGGNDLVPIWHMILRPAY